MKTRHWLNLQHRFSCQLLPPAGQSLLLRPEDPEELFWLKTCSAAAFCDNTCRVCLNTTELITSMVWQGDRSKVGSKCQKDQGQRTPLISSSSSFMLWLLFANSVDKFCIQGGKLNTTNLSIWSLSTIYTHIMWKQHYIKIKKPKCCTETDPPLKMNNTWHESQHKKTCIEVCMVLNAKCLYFI